KGLVLILLVEDDPAVAELYRYRLELDGHRVVVAPDGDQALVLAQEHRPALCFLDIRLPRRDGMAVLAALKKDPELKTIPVVMLTNYGSHDYIEKAMGLGAVDFKVKS